MQPTHVKIFLTFKETPKWVPSKVPINCETRKNTGIRHILQETARIKIKGSKISLARTIKFHMGLMLNGAMISQLYRIGNFFLLVY